jgi:hypothetical protein
MRSLTAPAPAAPAAPAPAASTAVRSASHKAIRAKLGVLATLAVVGAASGAPHWAVLVVSLACLAIPVAVAIQDGPTAARALLFIRPGHSRPGRYPRS